MLADCPDCLPLIAHLGTSDRRYLILKYHHIWLSRDLHLNRCCLVLSLVIALLLPLLNQLSLALRPRLLLPCCTSAQLVFEFKLSCYQVLVGAMHIAGGSVVADVKLLILAIVLFKLLIFFFCSHFSASQVEKDA